MVSYSFEGNKRLWTARDEEENEKIFGHQSKPTGVKIPSDIKPTYLDNEVNDVEKWPLIHLMRLLRFYAAHRCLWDVGCQDNRNRKMRQAAIVDITAALDIGVTKEQVVQKINILRATYRYEKKRIKQRIRQGLGARTKLKWFALADAFLRHVPKKGQKKEEPPNSDSDLEDTVVFTINPESFMPLDQDLTVDENQENTEKSLETKPEILSEDSPFYTESLETESIGALNFINCNHFPIKIERNESKPDKPNEDKLYKADQVENSVKKKSWTLKDTLRFLQLLENHFVSLELSLDFSACHVTLLESIANEMNYSLKGIEKRWNILLQIFREEKQKILENPQYKPKYKWWPEAEKLFDKSINAKVTNRKPVKKENVPTELIFLHETDNQESSSDYEESEINPIPSVAPLSNMNEAIASLFHENNDDNEDLSLESNTDSSYPKENESSISAKYVWQGLEDDLLEGKWSLKHSVKFLRLYGVHRCLWDLNDPDYRSRPLRNAAIEDIAACMGHGLTAAYVAKKIKIFRITYMQQRKRLLDTTKKGEKPEILLKWFPLADSFLRPHIGLRSIKTDAKEIPQFDSQYVYANLNLIDPALLTDFRGKGTQNAIEIGNNSDM